MNWDPDFQRQYALDRQLGLLADAEASRLVRSVPARRRFAQALRRAADRLDGAAVTPQPVGRALAERS